MSRARRLLSSALATALAAVIIGVTAAAGGGPSIATLTWNPMLGTTSGPLANDAVWAIAVDGNDVYVGGKFTDFAGIPAADRIVKWNGTDQRWEALELDGSSNGSITAGTVYDIDIDDGVLYVGGNITVDTGAADCNNLATFTLATSTWAGFGTCPGSQVIDPSTPVYTVEKIPGGRLYVGGNFTDANGDSAFDYGIYGTLDAGTWTWSGMGDDGAGGPALSNFVSNVVAHPDGGVLVTGDFGLAGGVTGANSNVRFDTSLTPNFVAQDTPAVTFYGALNTGTQLFASGWEGAYLYLGANSWRSLCDTELGAGGTTWGALALASTDVLLVGGTTLYACDISDGGSATEVPSAGTVRALASYRGATIVGGSSTVGTAGDYIALLGEVLPYTDTDGRQTTDAFILLVTLTAFTALAGTQLLRRA
jgi:hypothetical protein